MASTTVDSESVRQFEKRKADHIHLSLAEKNEAKGESGFSKIQLQHEALPDLDFSEISLSAKSLKKKYSTPFLVSSMTAGHTDSVDLNARLALACEQHGWRMGVGSQRRELGDKDAAREWKEIRKKAPKVQLLGNLGLAQIIKTKPSAIEALVEALEAEAMFVHLNSLQECIQPEGTPQFKGGLKAIEKLCRSLSVPVVVKETGCGFSESTLRRLKDTGVAAVDVSGFGGTHWGRIEGDRSVNDPVRMAAAESLKDWGISTAESLLNAKNAKVKYEIWASGGVRTGLDAAKALAMGATTVGFAKPILVAALKSEEALALQMQQIEFELKTIFFCLGVRTISDLQARKVWRWVTP